MRKLIFDIGKRDKKIEMTIGKVDGARRRKSKKENVTLHAEN